MVALTTYDKLLRRADGNVFPVSKLRGCKTGLVLFAAEFLGIQDAVWLAEAGIRCTCVDIKEPKLTAMAKLYPREWSFIHDDVYRFAAVTESTWDVVTLDCPSDQFEQVAGMPHLWTGLANKLVVMGSSAETHKLIKAPADWRKQKPMFRSSYLGGTYWTVLRRLHA